jgi:hypothetical protein
VRVVADFATYDLWGGLYYEQDGISDGTSPLVGWDGLLDGRPAPSGVYNCIVRVVYLDGITQLERGTTVLLG